MAGNPMQRLTDNKLIYGNLFEVNSPTLAERYNRALAILHGRTTALGSFRIDQSGFSPEVAEEFGDPTYLNPHGCNRLFVLLTVEQADLPLLDATFSCSRAILKGFIQDNRDALFALTARDAVFGELDDSVYKIKTLADITAIKRIRVKVRTTRRLISKSNRLARKIRDFQASDTAWCDDALLQEMIDLAEIVGDVRRQPMAPRNVVYEHGDFFTTHLGGLYVFNSTRPPTLVYCGPDEQTPAYQDATAGFRHIPITDRGAMARFLRAAELVENVADYPGLEPETVLAEKLDFIALDHAADGGGPAEIWDFEPMALRRYVHRAVDDLPDAFHDIQRVLRTLEQGEATARLEPEDPGYFYLLRATDDDRRDLVNHLLARLTPLDFRQLFICNKELFYALYQGWNDRKRAYVAEYLARGYRGREAAVWQRLYGDRSARRGPWGAVR